MIDASVMLLQTDGGVFIRSYPVVVGGGGAKAHLFFIIFGGLEHDDDLYNVLS